MPMFNRSLSDHREGANGLLLLSSVPWGSINTDKPNRAEGSAIGGCCCCDTTVLPDSRSEGLSSPECSRYTKLLFTLLHIFHRGTL